MTKRVHLNGFDCFLQSMDWELRRAGFAGCVSMLSLELESRVDFGLLKDSIRARARQLPVLAARLRRGFPGMRLFWEFEDPPREGRLPRVETHDLSSAAPEESVRTREDLFNQPFDFRRGELLRFDLLEKSEGRAEALMRWHHPLMDAHGAERLLALIGDPSLPAPDPWRDGEHFAGDCARRILPKLPLGAALVEARRSLRRIDAAGSTPPISLGAARRARAKPRQCFRFLEFSDDESRRVEANARAACGLLGFSDFLLAATMIEASRLQERLGAPSPSCVVASPVEMRKKGSRDPIFSTQEATLFYSALPESLRDVPSLAALLKGQSAEAMRDDFLPSYLRGMDLSRAMPPWLMMKLARRTMRGELASFFFSNTGRFAPELSTFMGARVLAARHVPAVALPPGIGFFFSAFSGRLVATIVHAEGILDPGEAASFESELRAGLLSGSPE